MAKKEKQREREVKEGKGERKIATHLEFSHLPRKKLFLDSFEKSLDRREFAPV